jgi:hypothetical protein
MYGCERTGCEVKALRRSLPDEAKVRRLWPRFQRADRPAERVRCLHGELRRPLATGPMQKRIHGLS